MRKFIQPVSMVVSSRIQYQEISQELSRIGYYCLSMPTGGYPLALITENLSVNPTLSYTQPNCATWPKYHLVHQWNPELFSAIAAMSSGGYWEGEWVVYRFDLYKMRELQDGPRGTKSIVVIENSRGDNVVGLESLHKASIEELTNHFTQPSVEVNPAWEPKNGEEVEGSGYMESGVWYRGKFIGMNGKEYVLQVFDDVCYYYCAFSEVRKITAQPTTTYTRSEAEQKLSEIVGKTVVIKD